MATILRILCSNSTHGVLEELVRVLGDSVGVDATVVVDSGKAMAGRVGAGEVADILVLGTETIREFARAGILIEASCRPFARTRVGVAVRRGFPRPDVSTVDALRTSLLEARSVTYTVNGASGRYIPSLFEALGIAEQMRERTITRPSGPIGPVVVAGEADIALQQLPELLAVDGLELVGLLPESVQKVLETSIAVFVASKHAAAASQLLNDFCAPANSIIFAKKGLEQVGAP